MKIFKRFTWVNLSINIYLYHKTIDNKFKNNLKYYTFIIGNNKFSEIGLNAFIEILPLFK
jgi:hypothetical protein